MRYTEYKATTIKWLKPIPSHWKEFRGKNLYRKESRTPREQDDIVTCFRDGQVTLRRNRRTEGFTESLKEIGYQGVRKGDLVIHVMDAFAGSIGVSDSDGKSTPVYSVCTAKGDTNNYYFGYLLREMARTGYIQSLYRGIRERSSDFRFDVFAAQTYPVPPREEQDQIVRYLDWQTSLINKLIHGYQRQIKLFEERKFTQLDMIVHSGLNSSVPKKESGIEYIGHIPEHWVVLQNHRIFKSMNRKFSGNETVLSLSQKDGLIPYENMSERSLHTSSYDNWQLVLPNDLVLNRFKAHLGVFFASNYRGISTFHYGVYEPKMPLISKYYETLYHTAVYRRVYAGQSKGMTVGLQNLSDIDFYTVYTVYPPVEEQAAIVSAIEEKEKEFLEIRKRIEREIELLKEYRTRLISDVVTGQIDVRGVAIPQYQPENDTDEPDAVEDVEVEE